MALVEALSEYWLKVQRSLFPWLEEEVGELSEKQRQLVSTLDMVRVEKFIPIVHSLRGRPLKERSAIARAFVAKAVYNMPTTRDLLERLSFDRKLRRICGWEGKNEIPSESTFSRAFGEFSKSQLAERVHGALVIRNLSGELIGHISRDGTEIEVRGKPEKKAKSEEEPNGKGQKGKPGRPKKGEEQKGEPTRLERQKGMTLEEMLEDLPKGSDVGSKKNSHGYKETWFGHKLHIDTGDGQIPVSCILTSASTHDSQAALPLAAMTNQRVTNLYDLMDSAYDAPIIREYSQSLGHVPVIDINPRRDTKLKADLTAETQRLKFLHFERPEDRRYKERTSAERVNARLKDEFGGRMVRVRGYAKIMTHLMFGILALTADQLIRLVA